MHDYDDDIRAVVIDHGSGLIKAGFGGETIPKTAFPSVIGSEKYRTFVTNPKDHWLAEDALMRHNYLKISYSVSNDVVNNWDDMEKLWHHTFYNEIRVAPEEHPILMTSNFFENKANKEKTTQIMFETFNVPALNFENNSLLSLFVSGRTTGIIVDCGENSTRCIPIIDGCIKKDAVFETSIGGKDLNDYLLKMLIECGNVSLSLSDKESIRDIKEKMCYIVLDWNKTTQINKNNLKKTYQPRYGKLISVDDALFKCPEVLFNPKVFGFESIGIHNAIHKAITLCNERDRKDLFGNIVLCGGSSMFPNFKERLQIELNHLVTNDTKIKIIASSERRFYSWIGGSTLSDFPTYNELWFTKEEYDESGPTHYFSRPCF
ncbi:actin [Entamoeba marina]